jgi:DMSO/TMAO reductase YedYZ molybdopterin-dependent catalytic subunit
MTNFTRGFRGKRPEVDPSRIPPGQYLTHDFPVLSAGPTPHTPLEEWTFSVNGQVDDAKSWSWDELNALPAETFTVDIHCVTKWSKLDTSWTGVSVDTLLADAGTEAEYLTAF